MKSQYDSNKQDCNPESVNDDSWYDPGSSIELIDDISKTKN